MKRQIRQWMAAILFVTTMGGAVATLAVPQQASAACANRLLTFPTWYRGLGNSTPDGCDIKSPSEVGGLQQFIWRIAFNVLEVMLQLVGYVSVGYIIYGGYKYMTSSGSSDGMAKARTTILNAIIGLGISLFSVAIVNLVAGSL